MIDDDRLNDILNPGSSVWLGNGIIFSISDIERIIKENPEHTGRTLPFKEVLHSVRGHRSHTNGAEREFIDSYADKAAEAIMCSSGIKNYRHAEVRSDTGWHRDYVIGKLALTLIQAKRAFSLNGSGIDAMSVQDEGWMRDVEISVFSYNLDQLEIKQDKTNHDGPGSSFLLLDRSSCLSYSVDLACLFRGYFPGPGKICPHAGGSCGYEVESLKSRCYGGSFKECEIYQNCIDDWK